MKRVWLFLALILAPAAAAACTLGKLTELPVTMEGLVPIVPAKVDGADMRLIVDSGSFFSLLTPQAAGRTGLHVGSLPEGYDYIVGLAGMERAGVVTAKDFTLAGNTFHRADFLVAAPQLGAEGVDGLLGDNILSFADLEFDLANGVIRLFKPIDCNREVNFAYWAASGGGVADILPSERPSYKIIVKIKVNGHDLRAVLDSGAGRSFITRAAAHEVGVSVTDSGVQANGQGGGIGHHGYQTWTARFDSFAIGDEVVKNAMLRIGDTDISQTGAPDVEMLLGADFLLSHRVYVANSQHKLYFTYNGGPVFNLDQGVAAAPPPPTAPAPALPGAASETPTDVDGFARRAAAFDARRDFASAIADDTRVIALQPSAEHYVQRAIEYRRNDDPDAALADLDAALKLEPANAGALLARGVLRLQRGDQSGGIADLSVVLGPSLDSVGAAAANDPHALSPLGRVAVATGWWMGAHRDDRNLSEAMSAVCWTHALWGKELGMVIPDCTAAVQRSPGDGALHNARGLVYLRLGDYQGAMADYDAELSLHPKDAWSLFGRGIAETNLGQAKEGQADLAAASALEPALPDIAKGYGITP